MRQLRHQPNDTMRITLSYAQTLDGRIAARDGSSQWISGPESLRFTHGLRAAHDVIMVGVGTVVRDNPRLTVRLAEGRDPLRVVVDSALRTPPGAAVLADGAASGTLIAGLAGAPPERRAALEAAGATVLRLPPDAEGRVSLPALVAALAGDDWRPTTDDPHTVAAGRLLSPPGAAGRRIDSIMVEGGARLITAMLRERLATHVAITVAPKILGAGIEAVGDLGIGRLADACALDEVRVTPYGADLVIAGALRYR